MPNPTGEGCPGFLFVLVPSKSPGVLRKFKVFRQLTDSFLDGDWRPQKANGEIGGIPKKYPPRDRDVAAIKDPERGNSRKEFLWLSIQIQLLKQPQPTSTIRARCLIRPWRFCRLVRISSIRPMTQPVMPESIALNASIGQTNAANGNVGNAISFLQTQNGYLQQVGSALDQMSTLAIEAQDVTKSTSERADYQAEYSTLSGYITDTATKSSTHQFAGTPGRDHGRRRHEVQHDWHQPELRYTGFTAKDISTTGGAVNSTAVTAAITQLGTDTATVGADTERLTYTSSELNVLSDNLSAANSAIADVDVATESTKFAADQILVQSGVSMLARKSNPHRC